MKKIVPFKKEISFKTNIHEITSISLDHELKLNNKTVVGNLLVSGSYKINDVSINVEEFKYNIPVNIEMSDNYILDNIKLDIEDFYYEIINNNILSVDIEVLIDNLEEVIVEDVHPIKLEENITPVSLEVDSLETDNLESSDLKITESNDSRFDSYDVKSLFDNFDDSNETFSTYKVCIIKETDTIESVTLKYGITKDVLAEYNDISDIKIGDKLIIPSINETDK